VFIVVIALYSSQAGIGNLIQTNIHQEKCDENDDQHQDRKTPPPPHTPQNGRTVDGKKDRHTERGYPGWA
jgi:hypothetical protein